MSEKQRTVLIPRYMQQFACIGSACEDTCCAGWRVNIDQDTYKKYRSVKHPEMTELLDKKVTRNRSNPSSVNYAKIKMNPNGDCPALDENKLCRIQASLGEDYLSNVCAAYPRMTNAVNGILERSATMSCPEITRLALLNPDGIEFDEIRESVQMRGTTAKQVESYAAKNANKVQKYFWDIRIFAIELLQNRSYSLAERLIVLGMFAYKVQEKAESGQVDLIPELMAQYRDLIGNGGLRESLSQIPVLYTIQMELVKELADDRISGRVSNKRYVECLVQYVNGIQYHRSRDLAAIGEHYKVICEKYYTPFMDKHEYILENYLVNYVFKNMFPGADKSSIVEEYIMMVVHYAMIKLHLIGMAGYHREKFAVDHVVKLIQSLAKVMEHNALYLKNVYQTLKDNSMTSMAYMAILIKN